MHDGVGRLVREARGEARAVHESVGMCRRTRERRKREIELPLELGERRLIAREQRAHKGELPFVPDREVVQCVAILARVRKD